ncbi:MAG: hypothetical protein GY822_20155 [Deltaproteobacteria bacterium]|nr:hypothetical protein [Deltaproteobacteria bacterium]
MSFVELLQAAGNVSKERLDDALERQVLSSCGLDLILMEMGLLDEHTALALLSASTNLPAVDRSLVDRAEQNAIDLFPKKLVERHRILPLHLEGRTLAVAVDAEPDLNLFDEIGFMLSVYLQPYITTSACLGYGLYRAYQIPLDPRIEGLLGMMGEEPDDLEPLGDDILAIPFDEALKKASASFLHVGGAMEEVEQDYNNEGHTDAVAMLLQGNSVSLPETVRDDGELEPQVAAHVKKSENEIAKEGEWQVASSDNALRAQTGEDALIPASSVAPLLTSDEENRKSDAELSLSEAEAREQGREDLLQRLQKEEDAESAFEDDRRKKRVRWTVDDAIAELALAQERDDIMDVLLRFAYRRMTTCAVFIVQRDVHGKTFFMGWDVIDAEMTREEIRQVRVPAKGKHSLSRMLEMQSPLLGPLDDGDPLVALLGRSPHAALVMPLMVADKLAAVLYADRGKAPIPPSCMAELHMVVPRLGKALRNLILRSRGQTPSAEDVPEQLEPVSNENTVLPTIEVDLDEWDVEEPAAVVEEPAAVVEEPAAVVEEPAAVVEEPAAVVEESISKKSKPRRGSPPPLPKRKVETEILEDGEEDLVLDDEVVHKALVDAARVAEQDAKNKSEEERVIGFEEEESLEVEDWVVEEDSTQGPADFALRDDTEKRNTDAVVVEDAVEPNDAPDMQIVVEESESSDEAGERIDDDVEKAVEPNDAPDMQIVSEESESSDEVTSDAGEQYDEDVPEQAALDDAVEPQIVVEESESRDEGTSEAGERIDDDVEKAVELNDPPGMQKVSEESESSDEAASLADESDLISDECQVQEYDDEGEFKEEDFLDRVVPAPSPGSRARESVLLATYRDWFSLETPQMDALLLDLQLPGDKGRSTISRVVQKGETVMPALARYFPGVVQAHPFGHTDARLDVSEFSDALACMTRMGADLCAPILMAKMNDDDRLHRYAAIWALSDLKVLAALPRLAERVFDPEWRIALLAIDVLHVYSDVPGFPQVMAELRKHCTKGDELQRKRAIVAVADLKDREALSLLVDLLGTRPKEISEEAHRALVEVTKQDFGSSGRRWRAWLIDNVSRHRTEWLVDGLAHKDTEIRYTSQNELNRKTGKFFGYRYDASRQERELALQKWRQWWSEEVAAGRS